MRRKNSYSRSKQSFQTWDPNKNYAPVEVNIQGMVMDTSESRKRKLEEKI